MTWTALAYGLILVGVIALAIYALYGVALALEGLFWWFVDATRRHK